MQLHDVPHTVTTGEIALADRHALNGLFFRTTWVSWQFFYRSDALPDAQPAVS